MTQREGHIGPLARMAAWVRAVFRRLRGLITGSAGSAQSADGPPAHWLADLEARGLAHGSWSGYGAEADAPPLAAPGRLPARRRGLSQPALAPPPEVAARATAGQRGDAGPLLSRPASASARTMPPEIVAPPAGRPANSDERGRDRSRKAVRVHTRVEVLTATDQEALRLAASPRAAAAPAEIRIDRRPSAPPSPIRPANKPSDDHVRGAARTQAQGPKPSGPDVAARAPERAHRPGLATRAIPDAGRVAPETPHPTQPAQITEPQDRKPAPVRAALPDGRTTSGPRAQGTPRAMPPPRDGEPPRLPAPPEADATARFPALPSSGARVPERRASAPDRFFQEADDALRRIVWGPR